MYFVLVAQLLNIESFKGDQAQHSYLNTLFRFYSRIFL
jgi:hypothetical protein